MQKQLKLAANALVIAVALAATSARAYANDQDRSSVGSNIVIQKGDTANNVACAMCSVVVHGTVNGNIAVFMGDVTVDGTVNQRVAVFWGNLIVLDGGVVSGDAAIAGGHVELNGGTINGRTATTPTGIIVAAFLFPVAILAGIIWLIVWLVRRNRAPGYPYPAPPPSV